MEERGKIAPAVLILGTRRGVSGQIHAPAVLPPGNNPGIHRTGGLDEPQSVWTLC